ncbi:hypothetical protein MMC21_007394 [Puttea exsequens]|nr:hypothetical protein [Puttea exsequens]
MKAIEMSLRGRLEGYETKESEQNDTESREVEAYDEDSEGNAKQHHPEIVLERTHKSRGQISDLEDARSNSPSATLPHDGGNPQRNQHESKTIDQKGLRGYLFRHTHEQDCLTVFLIRFAVIFSFVWLFLLAAVMFAIRFITLHSQKLPSLSKTLEAAVPENISASAATANISQRVLGRDVDDLFHNKREPPTTPSFPLPAAPKPTAPGPHPPCAQRHMMSASDARTACEPGSQPGGVAWSKIQTLNPAVGCGEGRAGWVYFY